MIRRRCESDQKLVCSLWKGFRIFGCSLRFFGFLRCCVALQVLWLSLAASWRDKEGDGRLSGSVKLLCVVNFGSGLCLEILEKNGFSLVAVAVAMRRL